MRAHWLLCTCLVACVTEPNDTATGVTPPSTETETETETSSTDDGLVSIDYVLLAVEFGYDAALDQAVPFSFGGFEYPPELNITVGEAAFFDGTDRSRGCTMFARSTGAAPRAPFADEAGLLFGFELQGPLDLDTNLCEGVVDLDEALAVADQYLGGGAVWGVGLQAVIGERAEYYLAQQDATGIAIGGAILGGSGPLSAALYDPTWGFAVASRMSVDHDIVLVGGAPQSLTRDEMLVEGALQTAFYYASTMQLALAP